MPKITTTIIIVERERVEITIKYNQKLLFFAEGIPEKVKVLVGSRYRYSGFDSQKKLETAIDEILKLYHEVVTKQRKVIAYRISLATALCMNKTGEGQYSGYKSWIPKGMHDLTKSFRGNGHGFEIEFYTYIEISGAKKEYRLVHEDGSISQYPEEFHNNGYMIIDWTQEREDTLKLIAIELEEMVKRVCKVFFSEKEMIKLLDSRSQLFLQEGSRNNGKT
jgi:hypothetical protein